MATQVRPPSSPSHDHEHCHADISQPVPTARLSQIATDACASALSSATSYDHAQTQTWNNAIINSILKALISESSSSTSSETTAQTPKYKFCVNSTIIQHLSDPRGGTDGAEGGKVGRRGMHSASGAYWNNERDGMWSFKWEGGEGRGMDIVVSVMWIAV